MILSSFTASVNSMITAHSEDHLARSVIADEDTYAKRFHLYNHFKPRHRKEICKRAAMLTRTLNLLLMNVLLPWSTCASTVVRLGTPKVSLPRFLKDCNGHNQIDFLFIAELVNLPVLYVKYGETGLSAAPHCLSNSLKKATNAYNIRWITPNGPPDELSAHLDFFEDCFLAMCASQEIKYRPRPAQRHNKTGSAEVAHEEFR